MERLAGEPAIGRSDLRLDDGVRPERRVQPGAQLDRELADLGERRGTPCSASQADRASMGRPP
jgi:hypothetical protein